MSRCVAAHVARLVAVIGSAATSHAAAPAGGRFISRAAAPAVSRRGAVAQALAAVGLAGSLRAASADTDDGERGKSLWPRDGLFPDCPADGGACISSQDDRPAVWDNPWIAEGALKDDFEALRRIVERLGGRVTASDNERYLRTEFEEKGALGGVAVDDVEFFFTPGDVLVQFRAERRGGAADFGANRKRLEKARIALGWEKVPVLRNRRRALVVVESPLDSFGPATYDLDQYGFPARDLVPAEAPRQSMYGDTDPKASPWKQPSKPMQIWMRESDDRVRSK